MSFWKFGLCLALLAVALSDQKPFEEPDEQPIENFELLRIIQKNVNKYIPKEELQRFVNLVKKTSDRKVINDEADEFLSRLNSHIIMEGFDPVELDDEGFEFQFRWFLIKVRGEMTLKNGWLQGLATLERVNDCTIEQSGKKMELKLSLTFTDLLFNYDYTAKFMGRGPKGGVDGSIRNAKFSITVSIDTETCEATLDKFKLDDQGKMGIRFTGNALGDLIANILAQVLTRFLRPLFKIFISAWVESGVLTILLLISESIGICV